MHKNKISNFISKSSAVVILNGGELLTAFIFRSNRMPHVTIFILLHIQFKLKREAHGSI